MSKPRKLSSAAARGFAQAREAVGELSVLAERIPADMTFRQWCEALAAERVDPATGRKRPGLLVDGKPFTLDDRPAMAWVYDQIPSTLEEARGRTIALMKCAQVGFTVMEILAAIYWALKFEGVKIGMFLPDMNLATGKSQHRFLPIVRTIPQAHPLLTAADAGGRSEGSLTVRQLGSSRIHFLWTSGKNTTESYPLDFVYFDEVPGMKIADMEKVRERMSASPCRFTLMGSTANWPGVDIHHWYSLGTQHRFHTKCPTCGIQRPLDDYFETCTRWDPDAPHYLTGQPGDYRYVCPEGHWIADLQQGEWIAERPDAQITSIHFTQMLPPTMNAGEIMEKFHAGTDRKNFYNRVLGKPWLDPSQTPVSMEHLNRCAERGMALGLEWKTRARGAFMGIDQMGAYNVAVIKERLADGRQAVIHLEEIYSQDPFARCDELMAAFGVDVCVVENLPNYNDAKRFANRHRGKVFLCHSYGNLTDDMLRWGDGPRLNASERRTDEDERDRYTVRIDQYKCMQASMARFTAGEPLCLFPDPRQLVQEVHDEGLWRREAVALRAFGHFTRTALVTEKDDETNQYKKRVAKVGIDPHFSYANLLCDIAFARSHGTATFIVPDSGSAAARPPGTSGQPAEDGLAGAPAQLRALVEDIIQLPGREKCRDCFSFPMGAHGPPESAVCEVYRAEVRANQPRCPQFVSAVWD